MNKSKGISEGRKALIAFVFLTTLSASVFGIGWMVGVEKGLDSGIVAGRGQIKTALPGVTYELRLVGVPVDNPADGYYQLEGVFGIPVGINAAPALLPPDVKPGDLVAFVDKKGFVRVAE